MRFQFPVIAFALCVTATGIGATFFESEYRPSKLESRIFKSKHAKSYPTLKRYRKIGGGFPSQSYAGSYTDGPVVHETHHSPVYKVQHRYRGYDSKPVTTSGFQDVSYHASGPAVESHSSSHLVNDHDHLQTSDEFLFSANGKPISTSRFTYAPHHDHHAFSFSSPPASFFDHHSRPLKYGSFFKSYPFTSSSFPSKGFHFGSGHSSFPPSFTFLHPEYSYASFFPSFPTESHSIQLPPSYSFVPAAPVHFPFPPVSITKPGLPYFPGYHHALPSFPAPTLPVLPPPLPTKIPETTGLPILSSVTPLPPFPPVSLQPPPVPSVSLQPPPVPSVSLQPPPVPSVSLPPPPVPPVSLPPPPVPSVTLQPPPVPSVTLRPPPLPSAVQQHLTFSHQPVFPSFSSTPSPFFSTHPKLEFSFPPSNVRIPTYVKDVSSTTTPPPPPPPVKVVHPHHEQVYENDDEKHYEHPSSTPENNPGLLHKIKSWKVEKASQALSHLQKHLGVADKTSATTSAPDHHEPNEPSFHFPETVHIPTSKPHQTHPYPSSSSSYSSHSTQYESFPPNYLQTPPSSLFNSYGIPIPHDSYSPHHDFSHDRVSSAASEEKGSILPPPPEFAQQTSNEQTLNADDNEHQPEIDQELQIQDLQRINPKLRPIYKPKDVETGEEESKTVEELIATTGNVNQEEIERQQISKSNSGNHQE